jgi:hypothetical protein
MADVIFLVLTAVFFAASIGLIHLFDRLRQGKHP